MNFLKRFVATITIASIAFVPTASHAITTTDENSLINDSVWFVDNDTDCGQTVGAAAEGKDNMETIWNNLIVRLKKPWQAAGIMGNMQSESGFDPLIIQPRRDGTGGGHSTDPRDSGERGYGLVQWSPGSKLIPYLHGATPSIVSEVKALFEQLDGKGPYPEKAAGDAVYASTDVKSASDAFEMKYERHAGEPQPIRASQADAILKLAQKENWLGANGELDTGTPAGGTTTDNTGMSCGSGAVHGGCTGATALKVPAGGLGTPVCYLSQFDLSGGNFDWPSCGCLPTSTTMIQGALQNKPDIDHVAVLTAMRKFGSPASNNCSGVSSGALAYMGSIGFKTATILPSHSQTTDATIAKIKTALSSGKLILAHTSNSFDSAGSGISSSGHFLVVHAMDAQGNFYVANPAARADNNKAISQTRIKEWLDGFWSVGP